MLNKKAFFFLIFLLSLFYSFAGIPDLIIKHDLESQKDDFPWTNQHTIITGNAYKGQGFSRTDSVTLYGIGWNGNFPGSFQGRSVQVSFSAFARIIGDVGKASVVFSILKNDSLVYWENRSINSRVKEQNVWTEFHDDFKLPRNITGPDYTLLVYIWNEDGKSICDIDEVNFQFSDLIFPSYLIHSDSIPPIVSEEDFMEIYAGNFFRMEYDKFSGQFRILSQNRRILIDHFSLSNSWSEELKDSSVDFENSRNNFFLRADSLSEDGKYFTIESRSDICETKIQILFSDTEPVLTFSIESKFNRPVRLKRQALSASFGPELSEVYKHSSLIDTLAFEDEYWLGKGGFQVFSDSAGFIIYHPENISSLQLNPVAKRFIVNVDWEMDHPLLHFPLMKKAENFKLNHSTTLIRKGSVLKCKFNIQGTQRKKIVPQLMRYSAGRSGAVIWTEHADYADLKLHKAVNFGSDSIESSKDAFGGFVKNGIPVTKSVFYTNPDHVMNSDKAGFVNTEIANLNGTPGFKSFLFDLQKNGQEICLHTPDQFTSTRSILKQAMDSMQINFNSVSWIDHGYDNAKKSNREDLVCDGLNPKSEYYSLDLWNEHNLRFFWNCFYEDTNLYSAYSFNSFLSVPYSGWGDRFPVPEYWRHPSRSMDLVHWRTTGTIDPSDGSMWNYYFSESRLEDLLRSHRTAVLHVYPARVDSTNGYYEFKDGHFQIQESFEQILQRQAKLRDSGRLELVNVKDYFSYQLALENLDIRFQTNGKIRIENKGGTDLKGISFSIQSGIAGVRGKNIHTRQENSETFFWFDLNKGEVVLVDIIR